ncbi:MAG: transglutaminase-like domain-containing protein [candidate division WWE3 bacterium]|nr:transglutaminase-like domain-containing protein [candidate division WWE3 bacterium]
MLKGLAIITLSTLLLLVGSTDVKAADSKFSTSYKTTYDVDISGLTTVTSEISLTNKSANFYASNYVLTLSFPHILEVTAYDRLGNCPVTLNGSEIKVLFNDKVVGLNSILHWTLIYKTPDLAIKKGRIWEVDLPKVEGSIDLADYVTVLKVPQSFGDDAQMANTAISSGVAGSKNFYVFSKNLLLNQGVAAVFGDYQVFKYTLKYHLKNLNLLPHFEEITLPPGVANYQETFITSLSPRPISSRVDSDGNLLAKYFLWWGQDLEITLDGEAKVYNRQINPFVGGNVTAITSNLKYLTNAASFWEVTDPIIKKIASDLYNPTKTVSQNAQNIYTYVVATLKYNNAKGFDNRLGAVATLKTPDNAVCTEFSDLFVALARSNGIPARELEGYAATNQDNRPILNDVLHAWAEYYDPVFGWVAVDPTWGNTAKTDFFTHLDANHLVFVIHGVSPVSPAPAGAFKLDITEKDQVAVVFADAVTTDATKVVPLSVDNSLGTKIIRFLAGISN